MKLNFPSHRVLTHTFGALLLISLTSLAAYSQSPGASGDQSKTASATNPDTIRVPAGFNVELLHSVDKMNEGSWVSMCVDPQGRLITSDQTGSLYVVTPPTIGSSEGLKIEKLDVEVGSAQGLLWAFDGLYVVVNSIERDQNGLYFVTDSDQDDNPETAQLLHKIDGDGEHGPHGIVLSADGKSLLIVCGNSTSPIEVDKSLVPVHWGEDRLLPRIFGQGFMRDTTAPGGAIYRVDPSGKSWERIASGLRNSYDLACMNNGELFTFDADMEPDAGAPWYRPTRVCHVVSGSEWGWRNGSAKWPPYFADTLPPVKEVGLSSPTGIAFGYGAKFPAKYQGALFLCDWAYGKMYSLTLDPDGATYQGVLDEFISATPLPLTDVVINEHDGAMYFLTGGRMTQSGLYRVTYIGEERTEPVEPPAVVDDLQILRRFLESFHSKQPPDAIAKIWPYLRHPDRFVRSAARVALEHQSLDAWQEMALSESENQTALTSLLALVRAVARMTPTVTQLDPTVPIYPVAETPHPLQSPILKALAIRNWDELTASQKLELLRIYQLVFIRLGAPDEGTRADVVAKLEAVYPAGNPEQDAMLTELLCYLQSPEVAAKGIRLLEQATTQEEQLDYVRSLQYAKVGWNQQLHKTLFEWFGAASKFNGGNDLPFFLKELLNNCVANTPADEIGALKNLIGTAAATDTGPDHDRVRPFVRNWTLKDLLALTEKTDLTNRDLKHGREMFYAARCYSCHHFAGEGGSLGPDLTGLAGRFSVQDTLESLVEPDKAISDQYATSLVITMEGRVIVGRLSENNERRTIVVTSVDNPQKVDVFNQDDVESVERSDVSTMPTGLLNSLCEDEVLDLIAYLLSRGEHGDIGR